MYGKGFSTLSEILLTILICTANTNDVFTGQSVIDEQLCIVLYCIVLYCIVLYCIVLYCIGDKDHFYALLI